MAGIYKITNKLNNKAYVGQTKRNFEERWREYKYRTKEPDYTILRAMYKYGIDNFDFEVLEECSVDSLNEREKYWIEELDTFENGYNETSGGDACHEISEEKRLKHKIISTEKYYSDENHPLRKINETGANLKILQEWNEKRMKKVRRVSDGKIYNSIADAYRDAKTNKSTMQKHLKRKPNFNTIKGEIYELV